MSKTDIIECAMDIDEKTGVSGWWAVADLEALVGFPLRGNGSPFLQSDRGLGTKYVIEKQRDIGNRLSHVRTVGFASYHQTHRASAIPVEVRKWLTTGKPCVMCGTTSRVVADHKDGNKQPLPAPGADDFQVLCQHCNTVKREICKKCVSTGFRFDAKTIGYTVSWTEGAERFQPRYPRCRGCYWYSPLAFRRGLTLRKEHE